MNEKPKYPGCCVWHHEQEDTWHIAWPNGNTKWDGGIEWLAKFREREDAEEFVRTHGGESKHSNQPEK